MSFYHCDTKYYSGCLGFYTDYSVFHSGIMIERIMIERIMQWDNLVS